MSTKAVTANVYMSREFILDFTRQSSQKKWLKRRELEAMESDPSVLDMIKTIQPFMGRPQEKLDKILYPNVAAAVATLRELLNRYPGTQGLHGLQNGLGFTRRNLFPSMTPLAPGARPQSEVVNGFRATVFEKCGDHVRAGPFGS